MRSKLYLFKKKLLVSLLINKTRKRFHVHPFNANRKIEGEYVSLIRLLEKYPEKFFTYFRMSKETFDYILSLVKNNLVAKLTSFRNDIICAKEKLVITLRFLATGASFVDLAYRFRMGVSTVKKVIDTTLEAINANCLEIAIPSSLSKDDWKQISLEFFERWNFPNCLGAVDGKHVLTFAPKKSGSFYFNYKKTFSYNLMAVVDAKYRFLMVDIGAYGSNADSTVFSCSPFGNAWLNNPTELNIPEDSPLPGTTTKLPYVIIGDEGFALKSTIWRPFPGRNLSHRERIFNYRLSRARRVVENAFGIMAHTWRILLKRLEVGKESGHRIILSCCILHNFLRQKNHRNMFEQENPIQDSEDSILTSTLASGYDVRGKFANWCLEEGSVSFQYDMI
ncbi:uncharacterized protein LOC129946823 [Eupeodes corollae]|uniref:uncharacterized protein LOC129946823 n=1 Tax=Eupeodes corollae TaxID=290404 RepID=UPI0024900592|nr:uncharacterized protein LOC129946823 [Eupeodes corollae]